VWTIAFRTRRWAVFEGKLWGRKKHGSELQTAANCGSQPHNSNNMSPYRRILTTVQEQKSQFLYFKHRKVRFKQKHILPPTGGNFTRLRFATPWQASVMER